MRPFDLSVYVITEASLARSRDQVDLVAAALRGGATMVQLRDKDLPARDLYASLGFEPVASFLYATRQAPNRMRGQRPARIATPA